MISGSASRRWLVCGAIAAASGGVVLALADVETPLRAPLVLLSLAAAPAAVVAAWLTSLDLFARILVAGAAAIALNALVAESMLALGIWSPRACLIAILLVCATGSVLRARPVRDALTSHRWSPHPAR